MKTSIFLALFIFFSACDYSNEPDPVTSLDGIYKIDFWALILNSDNTFAVESYPTIRTCGWRPYRELITPKLRRVIETPDSIKGTYRISNRILYFDKVYKVIKVIIHDYEHDSLYQEAYREALQKYNLQKIEEDKKISNQRKKGKHFPVFSMGVNFSYPEPTKKHISYHYDTIYYQNLKELRIDLDARYHLEQLKEAKNNYVMHSDMDSTIQAPKNLTIENYLKAIENSPLMKDCRFEINFNYYINESGGVDSLWLYKGDSCAVSLFAESKKFLDQVKDWPKGTLFNKPSKYSYYGSFKVEK